MCGKAQRDHTRLDHSARRAEPGTQVMKGLRMGARGCWGALERKDDASQDSGRGGGVSRLSTAFFSLNVLQYRVRPLGKRSSWIGQRTCVKSSPGSSREIAEKTAAFRLASVPCAWHSTLRCSPTRRASFMFPQSWSKLHRGRRRRREKCRTTRGRRIMVVEHLTWILVNDVKTPLTLSRAGVSF